MASEWLLPTQDTDVHATPADATSAESASDAIAATPATQPAPEAAAVAMSMPTVPPPLATPPTTPAPTESSSSSANNVMIMGYNVAFPTGKRPFPAQLAVMNKVLLALKSGQHALLESPTGSGKTLALLCSTLTFQKQFVKELVEIKRRQQQEEKDKKAAEAAKNDPTVEQQQQQATAQSTSSAIDDDDDDFASTQPSFDQFRFSNGATSSGDGWISMEHKKRSAAKETDANAPTQQKKRRLPTSFHHAAAAAEQSSQDDFDSSWRSMEDFHATPSSSSTSSGATKQRITPPQIFFCSRTHSQLAQVIDELKSCPVSYLDSPDISNPYADQLKTCVLGAKAHYCVNAKVNRDPSELDDKCRTALENNGCSYFRKRKKTNDLRRVTPAIWDLEDLVKLAKKHRECAFFHARDALVGANIVFCPYNYLLDPTIRESVGISLKNAIVVLDEAHNVEDTCRSSASIELTLDGLSLAILAFTNVIKKGNRPPCFLSQLKVLNGLHRWLKQIAASSSTVLQPTGFEEESKVWSGTDCLAMFAEYTGMTQETYDAIREDLRAVVDYEKQLQQTKVEGEEGGEEEDESGGQRLPAAALTTIRSVLNVAGYMYRDNLRFLDDFKLIVMKKRSHQRPSGGRSRGYNNMNSGASDWEFKLCIWCLNAAVAFSDVVRQVRSVILTSGTLSPMDSFAGELGTEFPIRLEASHVVDMRRQVFIGAVMNGPGGVDLSSVYRNQQEFRFQDSMGELLNQYAQVVPGGLLMFFPSYSLMEKLETRWRQTGVLARIEERKTIFKEPRQAGKDFDALLDTYKRTIATAMTTEGSTLTGAIFLAVYRGKVSEGIDFSNANARCVLAVGIPFPSVKELQVALKRKYQDEKSKVDRVLVSGSAWYSLQAFRALNQALGRCIRHRSDYGAIILVDSRYRFQAHTRSLSKWIRPFVREFEHAQDCVAQLPAFFERNATEFGLGIPTLPDEDARPPAAAPARPMYTRTSSTTKKKKVTVEYETTDPNNMASKMDSVRAYLAKRKEAEPSVFSIFMPKGTNPNANADTNNVRRWS